MQIKKAVFPVAGLGTNFLPATKASPKEMMPIVDMPLIQYAVNEAVAAGITELIFVTNNRKHAIENHFDSDFELEARLIECGKFELLQLVHDILPSGVTCAYIRQKSPLGLGDAILCAKQFVGNEPFAVLLADDLIENDGKSCLQQMLDVFEKNHSSIVAVQKVEQKDATKYGMVDAVDRNNKVSLIRGIIEKPSLENAPSDLAVVGRYILTPEIFTLLEQTSKGLHEEIQITDAIAKLLLEQSVFSLQFQGKRFDCGTKLGYVKATVAYALKHPEVAQDFRQVLQKYIVCSFS
jgi:UTP--glucose-1-phosphate uridylyltransferase